MGTVSKVQAFWSIVGLGPDPKMPTCRIVVLFWGMVSEPVKCTMVFPCASNESVRCGLAKGLVTLEPPPPVICQPAG